MISEVSPLSTLTNAKDGVNFLFDTYIKGVKIKHYPL